jgi:hypothetical protein
MGVASQPSAMWCKIQLDLTLTPHCARAHPLIASSWPDRMLFDRRPFSNCRGGRKSGFAANRARRRCPGLAPPPCRCGRCWRASCRLSRRATPGRAFERRCNCVVHPRIRWTSTCRPIPLILRIIDHQIVPIGAPPRHLVHVLKVFLVVAQIAANVAEPRSRATVRYNLVGGATPSRYPSRHLPPGLKAMRV